MVTQTWDAETVATRDKKTRSPGFFKPPTIEAGQAANYVPPASPGRQVSGRIFPNGEFGVGFVPHRGISANDRKYERDRRYAEDNAYMVADIEIDDNAPEGFVYTRKKVLPPPPKLGLGAQSSRLRKKYGLRGITSYGRKMVRNAGSVLDKAYKGQYNRYLKMGTVTLPSYSRDTMNAICAHWSDIVRKFFQKLRRIYARYRYPFYYVSVTEIQPTRLRERSEVGLHLHFLFCAIRLGRGKWVLPHGLLRAKWDETVNHYLGKDEEPQRSNYRCEDVHSSSSAYLAKYMSKGVEQVQQVVDEFGEDWLPSQWWSVDNTTRDCITKHTIRGRTTEAEMLLCICSEDMKEYYRYKREVTISTGANDYAKERNCPTEILLGYGGMLTDVGLRLFAPADRDESIRAYLSRTLDKKSRN